MAKVSGMSSLAHSTGSLSLVRTSSVKRVGSVEDEEIKDIFQTERYSYYTIMIGVAFLVGVPLTVDPLDSDLFSFA
jgi:hypothetical protein